MRNTNWHLHQDDLHFVIASKTWFFKKYDNYETHILEHFVELVKFAIPLPSSRSGLFHAQSNRFSVVDFSPPTRCTCDLWTLSFSCELSCKFCSTTADTGDRTHRWRFLRTIRTCHWLAALRVFVWRHQCWQHQDSPRRQGFPESHYPQWLLDSLPLIPFDPVSLLPKEVSLTSDRPRQQPWTSHQSESQNNTSSDWRLKSKNLWYFTSLNAPMTDVAVLVTNSLVFSGLKISLGILFFKAIESASYSAAKEKRK